MVSLKIHRIYSSVYTYLYYTTSEQKLQSFYAIFRTLAPFSKTSIQHQLFRNCTTTKKSPENSEDFIHIFYFRVQSNILSPTDKRPLKVLLFMRTHIKPHFVIAASDIGSIQFGKSAFCPCSIFSFPCSWIILILPDCRHIKPCTVSYTHLTLPTMAVV